MSETLEQLQAENAKLRTQRDALLEACKKANTCASMPDYVKEVVRDAIALAVGRNQSHPSPSPSRSRWYHTDYGGGHEVIRQYPECIAYTRAAPDGSPALAPESHDCIVLSSNRVSEDEAKEIINRIKRKSLALKRK